MTPCDPSISVPASVAVSSVVSSSVTKRSRRSKSILSAVPCSESEPPKDGSPGSSSTNAICANGFQRPTPAEWISCAQAGLARALAASVHALASLTNAADCGLRSFASLGRFDPATSSWKMGQTSWLSASTESSPTLPPWGWMRAGELWPLPTPALPMGGTAGGAWPTPCATDWKGSNGGGAAPRAAPGGGRNVQALADTDADGQRGIPQTGLHGGGACILARR